MAARPWCEWGASKAHLVFVLVDLAHELEDLLGLTRLPQIKRLQRLQRGEVVVRVVVQEDQGQRQLGKQFLLKIKQGSCARRTQARSVQKENRAQRTRHSTPAGPFG